MFNTTGGGADRLVDLYQQQNSTEVIIEAFKESTGLTMSVQQPTADDVSRFHYVEIHHIFRPSEGSEGQSDLNLVVAIASIVACIALVASYFVWFWRYQRRGDFIRSKRSADDEPCSDDKISIPQSMIASAETENPMTRTRVRYEAMFSYRVKSDEAIVSVLFDKVQVQAAAAPHTPRLFWDKVSLSKGQPWQDGFLTAVQSSQVLVCMVSWYEGNAGSVGQMASLNPDNGEDWQDNVLLEWEMGLILLERDNHPLASILPVFCGPVDSRGYQPFPFELLVQLPKAISPATKGAVVATCGKLGIELSDAERQRTIFDIVSSVLAFQGVKMQELGVERNANLQTAEQIAAALVTRNGKDAGTPTAIL
jgi:hypothetical protein